jgi:hypothetical protein
MSPPVQRGLEMLQYATALPLLKEARQRYSQHYLASQLDVVPKTGTCWEKVKRLAHT